MIKRTTIIEIFTILNIILFLYSGIAKIMDYSLFKDQLVDSPILSWAATPVAILLPFVEFAIVLLLVVPRWRLKGLCASFLIMTLFTIYIITMFIVAPEMPCSCGGLISELSWSQHIIFNSSFILLNLWAIKLFRKEKREKFKELSGIERFNVLGA